MRGPKETCSRLRSRARREVSKGFLVGHSLDRTKKSLVLGGG
jgi:hypothetical protein